MKVIYAGEEIPNTIIKSIMLCGPTSRDNNVESWRKDALQLLEDMSYSGTVFVPEPRDGKKYPEYDNQINWEDKCLNVADCIAFWIPRDLETLPAFTTNVEFGMWCESGKIVFGAPKDAPKNNYLKHYCEKYKISIDDSLTATLTAAMNKVGDGAERKDGEIEVPLFIWKTESFQNWYKDLLKAGNKLEHAKLQWSFRPQYKDFVFLWILKVAVFVTSENRIKDNEFVISRTDICSAVLYKKNDPIENSEFILIREFRSPVSNEEGFVYELPGGSSSEKTDPINVIKSEILEETGFVIDSKKINELQTRQLFATLSAHKLSCFSYELSEEDLSYFKSKRGVSFGNVKDTEITFIEVMSYKDIIKSTLIDWSNLGVILFVYNNLK